MNADLMNKAKDVAEALKYWMLEAAKKDAHFTEHQCTPEISKKCVKDQALEKLFSEKEESLDELFEQLWSDVEDEAKYWKRQQVQEERETQRLIKSHQPTPTSIG